MKTWPIQDANTRFCEFLAAGIAEGPLMVTKRGAKAAALVPVDQWWRMQKATRSALGQLLLPDDARTDASTPPWRAARLREAVVLGSADVPA